MIRTSKEKQNIFWSSLQTWGQLIPLSKFEIGTFYLFFAPKSIAMASNKIFLDADIVQLLAWLDFCAKTQVDFGETISDHLVQSRKERGEKDYPFTKIQAQDKLNGLARQSHKETYQHEILQAGSAYFTCLSSEIKAEIEIVLTQLLKLRSQQSRSYGATRAKSATADTLMPDPPLEAPTRKSMWRGKRKSQQNQPVSFAAGGSG